MTDHSSPQVGGTSAASFLRTRRQELTDEVLRVLRAEIPVYARLPDELLQGDVRRVVQHAIGSFTGAMAGGGPPTPAELEELRSSAARRAEEGVPMEMVLAAYFRGARVCAEALAAAAGPDDVDGFAAVTSHLLRFMEHASAAVASGYALFGRTLQAEQATSSQLLVNALVEGRLIREASLRAGVTLPPAYLVLSVAVGTHPDEKDPSVDPAVATRRKLRRLREELDRQYADPVLWLPATEGGVALAPLAAIPGDASDPCWAHLGRVAEDLQRAAGVTVHVGAVAATPEEVAQGVGVAHDVREVAQHHGRPGGVYRLADVALDYQLTRSSEAQPLLAALLDPLDDQPRLIETVTEFLASGLNRRRAAHRLQVHPNTVDNRLRRVARLTGLDPARPTDLPAITAALAARRAQPKRARDTTGPGT